jgi:DNA-binding transcriptional ArsR family regulator
LSNQLAKPLANAGRNRILMALHYLHPMSATQLTEAFGGSNLSSVARHLRALEEWGLLEIAGELRGGRRRGGIEKVYRPMRAAHFATPVWETLPHHLRAEWSGSMVEGLLLRLTQALRAGTFDAESDRHLSSERLVLDRRAWGEFVAGLDTILDWVGELEIESDQRRSQTGNERFPATVGLLAFRSPPGSVEVSLDSIWAGMRPDNLRVRVPYFLMSPTTAKALANPWRNRILTELHIRPRSAKQFIDEFGGPDSATVARYFRQLRQWGFLEVAQELRGGARRGSTEKVHRPLRRVHFNMTAWKALPMNLRSGPSGATLGSLVHRVNEAVQADTFDAETDRHVSWKGVSLDREAWAEYVNRLDEVHAWAEELEVQSAERLAAGNAEEIPVTAALMAFRSPESRGR